MYTCAHCGQFCGDYAGGLGTIDRGGETIRLCHPSDPSRPDCYRRVTVWHEPLGVLKEVSPMPAGIQDLAMLTEGDEWQTP